MDRHWEEAYEAYIQARKVVDVIDECCPCDPNRPSSINCNFKQTEQGIFLEVIQGFLACLWTQWGRWNCWPVPFGRDNDSPLPMPLLTSRLGLVEFPWATSEVYVVSRVDGLVLPEAIVQANRDRYLRYEIATHEWHTLEGWYREDYQVEIEQGVQHV